MSNDNRVDSQIDEQKQEPISVLSSLKPLFAAGLFMVAGILVLIYLGRDTARLMNARLEAIDLKPLVDADPIDSVQTLHGKVVVMHFWGTWCGPCKAEFADYAKLVNAFSKNNNVRFVTVSCSPESEGSIESLRSETIEFMHEKQSRIPQYCDPTMYTRANIARMLAAGGFQYPMTLVMDREGIVREFWLGTNSGTLKEIADVVNKQLKAPSQPSTRPPDAGDLL